MIDFFEEDKTNKEVSSIVSSYKSETIIKDKEDITVCNIKEVTDEVKHIKINGNFTMDEFRELSNLILGD